MQNNNGPTSSRPNEQQDAINRSVYHRPGVQQVYWRQLLVQAEIAALLTHQPALAGKDVLDIGVGTGRTTRYLAPLARSYLGIDYSQPMLDEATAKCPGVPFLRLDMREVATLGPERFDFVLAPDNVIDATSEAGRERVLTGVHSVLRPGGMFAFSSHNLRWSAAFDQPRLYPSRNPVRLARNLQQYARQMANHRRVRRFRCIENDHAILNDEGHDYSLLHYYIDRFGCEQQLVRAGFKLLSVFSENGAELGEHDLGTLSPSLFYVARREPQGSSAHAHGAATRAAAH